MNGGATIGLLRRSEKGKVRKEDEEIEWWVMRNCPFCGIFIILSRSYNRTVLLKTLTRCLMLREDSFFSQSLTLLHTTILCQDSTLNTDKPEASIREESYNHSRKGVTAAFAGASVRPQPQRRFSRAGKVGDTIEARLAPSSSTFYFETHRLPSFYRPPILSTSW